MDDTPTNLCLNHPEILRKLSQVNVFDLEPGEGLRSVSFTVVLTIIFLMSQ